MGLDRIDETVVKRSENGALGNPHGHFRSEWVILRYALTVQAIGLLFAAGSWWRAWRCLCVSTLQDAAFLTGLIIAQSVVVIGLSVLRAR